MKNSCRSSLINHLASLPVDTNTQNVLSDRQRLVIFFVPAVAAADNDDDTHPDLAGHNKCEIQQFY